MLIRLWKHISPIVSCAKLHEPLAMLMTEDLMYISFFSFSEHRETKKMPKFLSTIWTSIIEYETPRLVRIHNRKLGLVRRLIQFSIVCYVLVYALWLQQGYQEFTRVESSVTVKIKGVTKSELGDGTDLDPCMYL